MITYEEMQLEYAKSYIDKSRIYFIEKYLSTFDATNGKNVAFKLFPRQKVFLQNIASNNNNIAIKHRQCGITTVSSAWSAAQCVFASHDAPETILCIGNKLDLAQQLIIKIREFLTQVPRWFWGDDFYSTDEKSEKNKRDIFVKNSKSELELFNGCKVYARSSGINAARGISAVSILIFDEAAFIEDGLAVYSSAVAATASNPNRRIIMVSTPNGRDSLYYGTYKQALAKQNGYIATDFKWHQDLRYNRFLKWYKKDEQSGELMWDIDPVIDKKGNVVYNDERWQKLLQDGWKPTSPWYQDMCQSFNNDAQKIAQELDVSFEGSANNVVAPEFIEMQQTFNVREPLDDMKDPLNDEMWFWKEPIDGHRYILAIDPSRGVSEDNTAIEIIDMDGRDENGLPIVEQVAEYLGKRLGDDIGGMAYQYAKLYNDAFIVVDATGGQGDACILALLQMGYKNLYYDDAIQKNYTIQNSSKQFGAQYQDKLPGFHFQGNRYPVLSNFAGMVRNNEVKIRSIRVINELETWIFKGDTGRMDHMEGSHDDTLTSIAMALFVMRFSLNKLQDVQNKDKAILNAFKMVNSKNTNSQPKIQNTISINAKYSCPIYTTSQLNPYDTIQGNFMWLFKK